MRECPVIRCNAVVDVTMTEPNTPVQAQPVSLNAMKSYLKVAYEEDDALISLLIIAATQWAENRCGISILAKNVTAVLNVMNTQELPYGPVKKSTIVVKDYNGNTVSAPSLSGLDNGFIQLHGYGQFTVTYDTGYSVCPPELQVAIMAKVASDYEHRGDELDESNVDYARLAKQKSAPYKRVIGF